MITHGLVAIGGHGARLGLSGPAKSELIVAGRPALFWTLLAMRRAGVRHIVLAGESVPRLQFGLQIAKEVGFVAPDVTLHMDQGKGVCGLAYWAADAVSDRFIFDAGHSMLPTVIYREMLSTRFEFVVLATQRRSNPSRPSVPTRVRVSSSLDWNLAVRSDGRDVASLPWVLSSWVSRKIPAMEFDTKRLLAWADGEGILRTRAYDVFPEFDHIGEARASRRQTISYVLARGAIGDEDKFLSTV